MKLQNFLYLFTFAIFLNTCYLNADICQLDSAIYLLKQKNSPRKPGYGYEAILSYREKIVDTVLAFLESEPDNSQTVVYAMKLAGDYRIEEASDLLIKRITVRSFLATNAAHIHVLHPAYDAICKIGIPACSKILDKVDGDENDERLILYAHCIRCCYGDLGVYIIDQKISTTKNAEIKKKLLDIREGVKRLEPQR